MVEQVINQILKDNEPLLGINPIVNKINPASIITDGFYSLYYYTSLNRYWFDIISLLIFAFLLLVLSFIGLRRQKYDSI